jgi:hypothetical protein
VGGMFPQGLGRVVLSHKGAAIDKDWSGHGQRHSSGQARSRWAGRWGGDGQGTGLQRGRALHTWAGRWVMEGCEVCGLWPHRRECVVLPQKGVHRLEWPWAAAQQWPGMQQVGRVLGCRGV